VYIFFIQWFPVKLESGQNLSFFCFLFQAKNAEMVKKIHEERMGCVNVKIQIRLLQQQMLGAQAEEQSLI